MKISAIDGSIVFEDGIVSPRSDRQAFLRTALGQNARQDLVNEEWWHLHVKPERGVAANIIYRGEALHEVFVLLDIPADAHGDWTSEHELERKALHDDWLSRELGQPPYEYQWGRVVSEFDAKGCVSEIIVHYGQ